MFQPVKVVNYFWIFPNNFSVLVHLWSQGLFGFTHIIIIRTFDTLIYVTYDVTGILNGFVFFSNIC